MTRTASGIQSLCGPASPTANAGSPPLRRSADSFQDLFQSARRDRPAELEAAATELVSSAFVLPALASLRESPLRPADGPFAANSVEKRFGPLLDQQFADRVTKAARFSIVRSIVERFSRDIDTSNPAFSTIGAIHA